MNFLKNINMLKKHFILIFLFLYGFVSFAQTQGVLVTYKEVFDTFSPIERLAYLYATPNFSVFILHQLKRFNCGFMTHFRLFEAVFGLFDSFTVLREDNLPCVNY